jgi:hypothetical protein
MDTQLKDLSNINIEGTSEKSETPKLQSKKLMVSAYSCCVFSKNIKHKIK